MRQENLLELMQTLDDAWNARDWEAFRKHYSHDTIVRWPGGGLPTKGRRGHEAEAKAFFKTFPDNHVENSPYKVFITQGDWTCSVAKFTGTMMDPMEGPGGKIILPTHQPFEVELCTVAHWVGGEMTEENLFYDLTGLMKQIGLA